MTGIGAALCAAGLSYPVQEERAWVSFGSPLTVPLCRGRFWNADRSEPQEFFLRFFAVQKQSKQVRCTIFPPLGAAENAVQKFYARKFFLFYNVRTAHEGLREQGGMTDVFD